MASTIFNTNLKSLELLHRGKVRDLYRVDSEKLLIVQTDRISAFDRVLPTPIPGKGQILTKMTQYWFKKFSDSINHHWLELEPEKFVMESEISCIANRALIVKRLTPLPIEAVVRGYIAGSGWKEYEKNKTISGQKLRDGLKLGEKLEDPIFTPSSKAKVGEHDENISYLDMKNIVGSDFAVKIKKISLLLYKKAWRHCINRGIIVADTKFEFGVNKEGQLFVIDEILTPDSSRFWEKNNYAVGSSPFSFDKQFIRDWLENGDFSKYNHAPEVPPHIVEGTKKKYEEALNIMCQ